MNSNSRSALSTSAARSSSRAASRIAVQAKRAPRLKLAGTMSAGIPFAASIRARSRKRSRSASVGGWPSTSQRIIRSMFQRTQERTSSRSGRKRWYSGRSQKLSSTRSVNSSRSTRSTILRITSLARSCTAMPSIIPKPTVHMHS